jgi:arginyl-tRNA synthetase
LWLKSTDYGDDKGPVMKRPIGTYTYFCARRGHHPGQERGYAKAINQGMDHHGTIARVRAGLRR